MNVASSLKRSCAQHGCTIQSLSSQAQTAMQQQPLIRTSTRQLSSSGSKYYAQPTDLPSSSPTAKSSTDTQPKLVPSHAPPQSHTPRDQNHPSPSQSFTGTITRTGTMRQTVQVTRMHQVFDSFLQKHYTRPLRIKVHDPHPPSYLMEGDVVEYSAYTQVEKDTKQAKDLARKEFQEKKLTEQDESGKAVRKFRRDEAKKKEMQGNKARGVQYVIRKVVTPFGLGLEERMERLSVVEEALKQPRGGRGGQDSLAKGRAGNTSRRTARAAVAG